MHGARAYRLESKRIEWKWTDVSFSLSAFTRSAFVRAPAKQNDTVRTIFRVPALSPPFTKMQISVRSAEQLFGFNSSRKCRYACCCLFVEHAGCIRTDSSGISIFRAKHRQLCAQIIVRIARIRCNLSSSFGNICNSNVFFIIFYVCRSFYAIFFFLRDIWLRY